jgi:hypothetical protein
VFDRLMICLEENLKLTLLSLGSIFTHIYTKASVNISFVLCMIDKFIYVY